jgi:hypothetical protein
MLSTTCFKDPEIPKEMETADMCKDSCGFLRELECEQSYDLHYGQCFNDEECAYGKCIKEQCTESCESFCENLVHEGIYQNLACWAVIKSCDELKKCK